MAKPPLLAALGLVVYAAAALVLVHVLGAIYRKELRERRAAWQVAHHPAEVAPRPDPRETVASITPATPGPTHKTARPRNRPHKAAHPRSAAPPNREADREAAPEETPKPVEPPEKLKPLVLAGLENATAPEEALFGETLNKLILATHPQVDAGAVAVETLVEAARPMLELRTRKDLQIHLFVLESDRVNAFSHMGGYLYVTRGLLNFAGTEGEFQFVIGHELAHIDHRDGQALLAEATKEGFVAKVGTLQAMHHLIARGYTEAQEFAADDLAIERMRKLDRTARECLMFLRKLRKYSEDQDFGAGHVMPSSPPDASVQDVDNHIRAAPSAASRLARLEARLNATPARPGAIGPPLSGP